MDEVAEVDSSLGRTYLRDAPEKRREKNNEKQAHKLILILFAKLVTVKEKSLHKKNPSSSFAYQIKLT